MGMVSTIWRQARQDERWRVIFAGICALVLSVGIARFAYTPLMPQMHRQAGLSELAGGWLATINYAGYMSGALLAASIGDLGKKFMIYRIGLVVAVLSTAGMGLTDNIILWGLLRYVSGFSSIAGLLLASGLVLNWLMRHRRRPELGLHFIGLGLGIVVSGIAVALMAGHLAWNGQWIALGVLGIAFFIPAWRWLPAPVSLSASAVSHSAAAAPARRWFWLMIAAYFCGGFGFAVGATYTVAILEKLPLLAGKGSWVWVIVGISATPACFVWDRIAGVVGQIRALMLAYALQMVSIMLPVFAAAAAPNILGAVLFGSTFVGIVSLTLVLIGRHFPDNPAKAMARMTLSYGVAQIIAPAMTGNVVTATGSYHGALVVTVLVMAVGMVLLQCVRREERRGRIS